MAFTGCFAPRAGVEVYVERIPNHHWFCLVQEQAGRRQTISKYVEKMGYSLSSGSPFDVELGSEFDGGVREVKRGIREGWRPLPFLYHWELAERYGFLLLDETGLKVWWFAAEEVPVEGRDWVTGGGRVRFRLDPARAESATRSEALEWGVSEWYFDNPGPLR